MAGARTFVIFVALAAAFNPVSSTEVLAASSLKADEAILTSKNRPVSKVIALLKDMLKQLEKEQEEDEEIYDKLACWCENNDKEKTKDIKEAEVKLNQLTASIEALTGDSARLGTELQNLEKEVAQDEASLDKATAIRQKQLAEFNEEEKDLLECIAATKQAIVVLSKHHQGPGGGPALVQVSATHIAGVQHAMEKHAALLKGVLTQSERKAMTSFLQSQQDTSLRQAYAPQSGEIFGILKQMKETFETNLADAQKEEAENQKAFQELKAGKEEQIAAGNDQIDKKTQEKAETDEKNAQSKEDAEETRASLTADQQFLLMLKEKCQMTDMEWEERQKVRQGEMEAVSKALAVLNTDDAHDLFTRTFNPALMQESATMSSERRTEASQLLSAAAKKLRNPRLAQLAVRVRLDAFTRVKKAINDMIAELRAEKEDEIKHKDWCVDEFHTNEQQTIQHEDEKSDLETKIEDLEQDIKQLTEELDTLKTEVATLQDELKKAGEDREKENQEFHTTIADQRETQKLLEAALGFLKGFYAKGAKKAALLQQEPIAPPPPPGFDAYKKNENAPGVIGMIEQIIKDAKTMEKETIRDEEDAQKAYEDFVQESNASIEAKSKEIVTKTDIKAKKEAALVQAKEELDKVELELEQLSNYKGQLHESCDYILKNFEVRQTARDEEIEALKQAIAILSGAKFEAFLQATVG